MKKIMFKGAFIIALCVLVYACGKDDDPEPEPGTVPTITSFTPTSGVIGTQVTITGTNFGTTTAANVVKFGTVTATVSTASATSLVTTVPVGTTTGKISVTVDKKTATSTTDYTVTKEGGGIALDNTTLTLYPYPFYAATLKVTTAIVGKTVTWTSSDKTLAKVSADGVVTPLAVGSVTITATVGISTGQCVVTIKEGPVTKLELDNSTLELYSEDVAKLKIATVEAEVAETSPVVWSSSDEAIATVDDQGNVTAISSGEAIITATVDNKTATCTVTVNPNVYVAGREHNGTKDVATVWKNGVAQPLTNGSNDASAQSVYVDEDGNVYATGGEDNDGGATGIKVWKNGEELYSFTIPNTQESFGTSIVVNGTDVYTASTGSNLISIKLWKNDQVYPLQGSDNLRAELKSVFVYEEDVYALGNLINNLGVKVGVLWKNGNVAGNVLGYYTSNFSYSIEASSVYVSDGAVYVTTSESEEIEPGVNEKQAKVYKDGVLLYTLAENTSGAVAASVYVSGGDVYVVGEAGGVAMLWKNGEGTELTDGTSAKSVFVNGADVYVAGYGKNGNNVTIAKLWKNGELLNLSDSSSRAFSVFVK